MAARSAFSEEYFSKTTTSKKCRLAATFLGLEIAARYTDWAQNKAREPSNQAGLGPQMEGSRGQFWRQAGNGGPI